MHDGISYPSQVAHVPSSPATLSSARQWLSRSVPDTGEQQRSHIMREIMNAALTVPSHWRPTHQVFSVSAGTSGTAEDAREKGGIV